MKRFILPTLAVFAAAIAQAAPADDVSAAAKKLADAANYGWTQTTEIANTQFPAFAIENVTEKGGYTVTTFSFNGTPSQVVRKGDKTVRQNPEGAWMTNEEMAAARGGGRGSGGFGTQANPAEELVALAAQAKDLKVADGVITGALNDEAVTQRLSFGGGRGGQAPAAPKNASGTVKFWLKDGAITKYQINVKGTVAGRDGAENERNLTTTVEIKNVGSSKVTVPEEAKKKLGA